MRLRPLPAALVLLGFYTSFHSLTAGSTEVEPVIVTATRTAQTAAETLAAVTVITRKDIERRQAQSVQDLLRGTAGFSIANNGGAGKATSVFLRGTESDHVLVLIDGVKIGSATLGTAAFQDLPVELIERIEIVRGPRSSLYGSEAIGGVIQIFTRKGRGPVKPSLSLSGGSFDTYDASAGVSGGDEREWFSAQLSGIDTEGFNACDGTPAGAGCFTDEPDKDGYRNSAGALRGGLRFDNGAEADLHWLRSSGDTEFDGSFVNASESMQQALGGSLRWSPLDAWQMTLAAGQSRDESDNFKDGAFQSRFDTERDSFTFQNDVTLADTQLLTVGLDYQDDRVDGTTAYAVDARDDTGLFTQYQGAFGGHDVQLSLRRDDNEQFGNHNTGGVAWGYALRNALRLTAAYGSAFKAPTFNELYFPGFGNANLHPEESRSLEVGVAGDIGTGRWSLNAFGTRIDELIGFDASFTPTNIDEARILGIEAVLGIQLAGWDFDTNLTLLDPENRSGDANDGNVLPRRARQSLRFDADRQVGKFTFGTTLFTEGKRYDDLANNRTLGGYTTLDLRGEYRFAQDWRLQARVANLFDKDYETADFYNQPGRSLLVTLRYQP